MNLLYLFNKNLYIYILQKIYGLNLYMINILFMINNISIYNINKIKKIKFSLYRLNLFIYYIFKIKSNNIILNKIKKFNLNYEKTFINKKNM